MRNHYIITGAFVLVGIALFTVAVFLVGNQHRVFAKHVDFYAEFASINGITKGSKVRVGGFDGGEVSEIRLPDSPAAQFRLTLRVVERVHVLIRSDSLVTVISEGIVGDKLLQIHPGSANLPEAAPESTLRSKEAFDMAELLDRSASLLNDASGSMKEVSKKLTGTLDAVRTTVNNANDLVVGVKQGKGTVGLLLRDEHTAENLRHTLANVQQASVSVSDASNRANNLISDFESRDLGEKVDQSIASVQSAARNIDASSLEIRQTLNTALGPDSHGVDAAGNVRQSLSNLNLASGNMAENTEALKHQFFFRGFFKRRGYYSLANLKPDSYRNDKFFGSTANPRVWLDKSELFESKQDGNEELSLTGKAKIEEVMAQFGDRAFGGAIVVEGYSTTGDWGAQIAASRVRAVLVRQYLQTRFVLSSRDLGIVALRDLPPPTTNKANWDGVCLVLLNKSRSSATSRPSGDIAACVGSDSRQCGR
jgi:phospholipid/cholesterol/gamma-HCH transport system substrate-binding protein